MSTYAGVQSLIIPNLDNCANHFWGFNYCLLAMGIAIDVIIAASMMWYLTQQHRNTLSKVTCVIDQLLAYTIRMFDLLDFSSPDSLDNLGTGLFTSIAAIIVLVLVTLLLPLCPCHHPHAILCSIKPCSIPVCFPENARIQLLICCLHPDIYLAVYTLLAKRKLWTIKSPDFFKLLPFIVGSIPWAFCVELLDDTCWSHRLNVHISLRERVAQMVSTELLQANVHEKFHYKASSCHWHSIFHFV